jgi:hypothetical protein
VFLQQVEKLQDRALESRHELEDKDAEIEALRQEILMLKDEGGVGDGHSSKRRKPNVSPGEKLAGVEGKKFAVVSRMWVTGSIFAAINSVDVEGQPPDPLKPVAAALHASLPESLKNEWNTSWFQGTVCTSQNTSFLTSNFTPCLHSSSEASAVYGRDTSAIGLRTMD